MDTGEKNFDEGYRDSSLASKTNAQEKKLSERLIKNHSLKTERLARLLDTGHGKLAMFLPHFEKYIQISLRQRISRL